jgi:undecaprenyl diphosphate synthase
MDGNKRWSKKNNLSEDIAYTNGAKKIIDIAKFIFNEFNVPFVSAFAISKNNLNRPKSSIKLLINILDDKLNDILINSNNYQFNIIFLGDFDFLPSQTKDKIDKVNLTEKQYNNKLIIFLNYSGQFDILNAYKHLLNKKINFDDFHNCLITKNIPNPDIILRTGGFKRISDFLLYQIAFTELFFTKTLWPDIKNNQIRKIINEYKSINRKYGR